MIVEKQTEIEILSDGDTTQDAIKMSLDLDSANMLMQMLSKNLYSDGIGSSIRETASNALDSHRKANVDTPIIVSFIKNDEGNYEFTVEDFGTGLDADDVENIISKYGKSTKRLDANALGMFGLGFKSPLAYSASFYFICRKAGIERKYMMYEGDEENKIDFLYTAPTTEPNGVKVIIPVKYNDRWEFVRKIKEQLAYFEGVYFHMKNIGDSIDNDFKIHRNDIFQTSDLSVDSNLHLCLDNVYYPIDFTKLGIPRINYGVALRFNLTDGLFPTPNREAIRYTTESKKVIMERLGQFADYMVDKYNESIVEAENIKTIFDYYNSSSRYVSVEGKNYDISNLLPYTKKKIIAPKLKDVTILDLKHLSSLKGQMFGEYEVKFTLQNDRFSENKGMWNQTLNTYSFDNYDKMFLYNERIGSNKKIYIKTLCPPGGKTAFIKKTKEFTLLPKKGEKTSYDNYFNLLSLKNIPKKDWRGAIKEFQSILQMIFKNVPDFDKIVIPEAWLNTRKKKRASVATGGIRKVKLQGEIVFKEAETLLRYVDGKTCKFTPGKINLADIYKQKVIMVYGTTEQQPQLDALYNVFTKQPVRFLSFSQRELNVIKDLETHNLMSIETFMEGKNKPFRRLVTSYLIAQLIENHRSVFDRKEHLKGVSRDFAKKLETLSEYEHSNILRRSEAILPTLLEVAETYNLFDETIYPEYKEMRDLLNKLTFLQPIMGRMRSYGNEDDLVKVITDLFKYYKTKVNFENYHMRLNEDLPLEAVLTEDTVNELTAI